MLICLLSEKFINEKYFEKKKFAWFPEKYVYFILGGIHFQKVVKN
jgi:hypothetical protein